MTAFFFGATGRQLFGYYHAASAGGSAAAVLCPSWGPEYQYAHRALRTLARRLAERGVHVLRFDYSGTGDSWGDGGDVSPAAWVNDVSTAMDELRAMSGTTAVDLVGLRLGGYIAARAASGRSDVRRLVLWDPVTHGDARLEELAGPHRPKPVPVKSDDSLVEIASRVVSIPTLEAFRAIRPADYPTGLTSPTMVVRTGVSPDPEPLVNLNDAAFREVEDAVPWLEDSSIWSGLIPARSISAIAEWMTA